jgi:hypothetical protein
MVTQEYRGCEFVALNLMSDCCQVNITSDDPHLMARLGGNVIVRDPSKDQAIAKAKQYVDAMLG